MKSIKTTLKLASLGLVLFGLTACSSQNTETPVASSSSSQVASSSSVSQENTSSSSSNTASNSQVDGTYTGSKEGEQITLELTGNQGTWTEIDMDGEQEMETVQVDMDNQQIRIGDDIKGFSIEGDQIIITDLDQDLFEDDTIVLTKQ